MPRTALEIVQSAAPRLSIDRPDTLFSSTDQVDIEVRSTLNECAVRIAEQNDWQALLTLDEDVGDGSTTSYSLPTDWLRMPKDGQVWSTRWQRPLLAITAEESLRLDIRNYDLVTGTWTVIGGNIVYNPALASGESAKYYYVSRNVCSGNKERFTEDTDTYRLDDRVLELALIWQWREQKGMDYAEDMATAENALARAIERDKGGRIITQSSRRNVGAKVAYPWSIEP